MNPCLKTLLTTETDSGVTHTNVLGNLDEGVGHLGGVGTARGRGDLLDHGEGLRAEVGLTETLKERQNTVALIQLRSSWIDDVVMEVWDGSIIGWRCDGLTLRW